MKETYINKYGQVVNKHYQDIKNAKGIKSSWENMCLLRTTERMTKKEHDFFERYRLRPTIFNVSNLKEYGHIHLTPHYVQLVLKNGAIDTR